MSATTNYRLFFAFAALLVSNNCADYKQQKEWDGIDYSKVRDRDIYENDSSYTPPSVIGCTNDDLFNCN